MTLREQFENETGLITDNCMGIGDIGGLQKDYGNLSHYCEWLEAKLTSDNGLRVYVRWRLEALHLIIPQKLIKRTNVE